MKIKKSDLVCILKEEIAKIMNEADGVQAPAETQSAVEWDTYNEFRDVQQAGRKVPDIYDANIDVPALQAALGDEWEVVDSSTGNPSTFNRKNVIVPLRTINQAGRRVNYFKKGLARSYEDYGRLTQ